MHLQSIVIFFLTVGMAAGEWKWAKEITQEMKNEVVKVMEGAKTLMKKYEWGKFAYYDQENVFAFGGNDSRRGAVLRVVKEVKSKDKDGKEIYIDVIRYFGVMYSPTSAESHFEVRSEEIPETEVEPRSDENKIEESGSDVSERDTLIPSSKLEKPVITGEKKSAIVKSVAFTRRVDNIDSAKRRIRRPKLSKLLTAVTALPKKVLGNTLLFLGFPIVAMIKLETLGLVISAVAVLLVVPAVAVLGTCAAVGAVTGLVKTGYSLYKEFRPKGAKGMDVEVQPAKLKE